MLLFLSWIGMVHASGVVINEVLVDPGGADAGLEWIELYNAGDVEASLAGWQLRSGTSSYGTDLTFDEGTVLAPGAFLVVGESSVDFADIESSLSLGNAGSSSDAIQLVDVDGVPVDTLVYGSPNSDGWLDDLGVIATSLAPAGSSDESIARSEDGVDTDASASDFVLLVEPTPGAANAGDFTSVDVELDEDTAGDTSTNTAPIETPVDPELDAGDSADSSSDSDPICVLSTAVKINEIFPDPSSRDDDKEWLELYNASDAVISLAGWQIESGTRLASLDVDVVFGSDITIGPRSFLVVGESLVVDADVVAELALGNASSNADLTRLVDCDGRVMDSLVYGPSNEDDLVDDTGEIATSLAPMAPSDQSIGRLDDGGDTDMSAMDFAVFVVPTPGWSNVADSGETGSLGGSAEAEDSGDPDGVDEAGMTGDERDTSSAGGSEGVDTAGEDSLDGLDTASALDDSGAPGISDTGHDSGVHSVACAVSTDIKINETLVDPEAPAGDEGHEWIEIYNRGSELVSLHGWQLQGGTTVLERFVEFDDVVVGPGDFLLVGGSAVSDKDVEAPLDLGNATSDSDIIQLMDCRGRVADTLIYGAPNIDGWVDDSGEVATSTAPAPSTGESIARSPDGADSDDAGVDFVVVTTPTPGSHASSSADPTDTGDPFAGCEVSADVKINEVLADPDGADGGFEWIELYNSGSEAVSLSGWQIEGGTSSLTVDVVFGAGAFIEPEAYFLVGESSVSGMDVVADLSLGNAGSSSDITRLVDCFGAVADTLVYGEPNTDEWRNDRGEVAASFASVAPESSTMARVVDGVDTDASAIDFATSASPTPGASNAFDETDSGSDSDTDLDVDDAVGVESDCPGSSAIKINEVMVDPGAEGGDDGHEWIELFNAGTETVNLEGWVLGGGTSSVGTFVEFGSGISMSPGEHLLVGDEFVAGADVLASISLGNAGSSADIVQLRDCSAVVVDTLVYGEPNTDEWVDDGGGVATSLAPKPGTDHSLARISDGYDTNACATDFVASEAPTPGSPNPATEPIVCVEGSQHIKINEFMVDPDAALVGGEASDADLEWVELYNSGDAPVSIAGWKLQWGKSGTYPGSKVFAAGVIIAPGDWLLVGGSLVAGADVTTSFDMGNASSSSDAVRLMDCAEVVQDTVIYGPNNDDGWLDDEDEVASSFAEAPGKEKSAARVFDGVDTEQSGMDFVVVDAPTPGASNEGGGITGCSPGEMDIKINEILPDPEGTDDGFEFIELFNTSDEDLSIEGWAIATGTSSWPRDPGYRFPSGATISAGDFVVIAGNEVEGADFYIDEEEKFSLGNGSSAPDGVRLEDCAGEVQDTVLYGDPLDPIEDLELDDDQGLSSMATMPESNLSAGRSEDGVDTDDNAADFTTNMPPTPGESNAVREIATESGGGCGCGGKSEGPDGGADGPMEAGAVAGLISSLILLVALRRREDR